MKKTETFPDYSWEEAYELASILRVTVTEEYGIHFMRYGFTDNPYKTPHRLIVAMILTCDGAQRIYPEGWAAKDKVPEILLVPLEDLPLCINEDSLTSKIAKWRLKIGK